MAINDPQLLLYSLAMEQNIVGSIDIIIIIIIIP